MERMAKVLRTVLRHLRDSRGVSLYEITAAVAMTGILAAVAVPVIIDRVGEAKSARAVQETDALFRAMSAFQKDTGLWPGELEGVVVLLTGSDGVLADLPGTTTELAAAAVGSPVAKGTDALRVACPTALAGSVCANVNKYLVSSPNGYGNWKGPYLDEVKSDPFDRSYIINVRPLYAAQTNADAADATKTTGYGWILSGGADRELKTKLTDTKLEVNSDDIGKNNGKKIFQTTS